MTGAGDLLDRITRRLGRARIDEVELYLKEGRSHRVETGPQGRIELRSEEAGWALRAGGRGSFFACGTGRPDPEASWPAARGERLQLPEPRPSPPAPEGVHTPLIVESEALAQLAAFERALTGDLAGARVTRAILEDGASEARLVSSRGMDLEYEHRAATLFLEVVAGDVQRSGQFAARSAADFDVAALARRFGTLLGLARDGAGGVAGGSRTVLAPAAAVRLVAGLLPLLLGEEARELVRPFVDRSGRIGSSKLTLVDDGRLPGGLLAASVDGEGVPTREVVLIEEGHFRQPLLSWREASPSSGESSGCSLRPSWRQEPRQGATHLYVQPDLDVSPAEVVASVADGFYGLEALGPGRFDVGGDSFELRLAGFSLRDGRAVHPVAEARLSGRLSDAMRGVVAVARDLMFQPIGFLLGAPTLLLDGVELNTP